MMTLKENTTLVGISELRTKINEVLTELKKHHVLIEKRNKPVAMLLSIEEFERLESLLEFVEDYGLAILAKQREGKGKYLSLEEAKKKAGLT
ncbi:MAG: type II toxin-antitoxin system Phd/YefM family antitoxin [Candidatus Omnitrophica bacterium]|nr:type II toxin-antitoxin system Phd/YefM family antitoxin [Candidatus Omnitrophota bacterium]